MLSSKSLSFSPSEQRIEKNLLGLEEDRRRRKGKNGFFLPKKTHMQKENKRFKQENLETDALGKSPTKLR